MKDASNVKAGDLVKRISPTGEDFDVKQGEIYKVKAITYGGKYLMVEGSDQHFYINSFEVVNEHHNKYRLMKPDTSIKVSVDGHEFEVPLGDLIRMQKVCGAANGKYGYDLWRNVQSIIDEDRVIQDNKTIYELDEYVDIEESLLEEYFKPSENLKRKAEIQESLKVLEQQVMKLHQELESLGFYQRYLCSI